MARFYEATSHDNSSIWVYSERGVLNYAFCANGGDAVALLLHEAINGNGRTLAEVIGGTPGDTRLLTEFDLGSNGFGCPDNGLHFHSSDGTASFVFIEGKAGPLAACWQAPPAVTPEQLGQIDETGLHAMCRANSFNSSINGQLELRWRFVNALRAAPDNDSYVTERAAPPPEAIMHSDRFYWRRRLQPRADKARDWRRVQLGELRPLQRLLRDVDDFYLMAVTADQERPTALDQIRLYGPDQQPLDRVASRVFWLPFARLAGLLDEVTA